MNERGIADHVDLFEKNYFKAYKDDFEAFKIMVQQFYEGYRKANPTYDFSSVHDPSISPRTRVYRVRREVLADSGVTEERMFYYYLLTRYKETAKVTLSTAHKKANQFIRRHSNKTIASKLESLNTELNKHPDIVIKKRPTNIVGEHS